MKKPVNPSKPTCHDVGACLQRPDCPCTGACVKARQLAPIVMDGPYYRRTTRTEYLARVLLLMVSAASVVAVAAQLAGWL